MTAATARKAILRAARECEDCLRLADFAEREPSLSAGSAASLRKFAAYHSQNAFQWARHLARPETAA